LTSVRKGQYTGKLDRDVFGARFRERFHDPAFRREDTAIARLEQIAWEAYVDSRKSPLNRRAGEAFADPVTNSPLNGSRRAMPSSPPSGVMRMWAPRPERS
jgi:hypothetical protein